MPALKDFAFSLYLSSGFVPLRDFLRARRGLARAVVLCYHRIGQPDVLTTSPEKFARDLAFLQANHECLTVQELCRKLRSGKALARPLAAVTFDDGYRDNYTLGVPLLQAAGVPATFFVSTGFMSTTRVFEHDKEAQQDFPKLTWDDLRAMQNDGFEIGSHTVNHADMGQVNEAQLQTELQESLMALNQELGVSPRAFAFPYGKPQNMTQRAISLARETGYYAVMAAYGGDNTRGTDGFPLQRVDAGNGLMNEKAWQTRISGFDPDYLRYRRQPLAK